MYANFLDFSPPPLLFSIKADSYYIFHATSLTSYAFPWPPLPTLVSTYFMDVKKFEIYPYPVPNTWQDRNQSRGWERKQFHGHRAWAHGSPLHDAAWQPSFVHYNSCVRICHQEGTQTLWTRPPPSRIRLDTRLTPWYLPNINNSPHIHSRQM